MRPTLASKRSPRCPVVRGALAPLFAAAAAALASCAPDDAFPAGSLGSTLEAATVAATADWSQFPDGHQCLVGVQLFYPARFGARVPVATGPYGNCASQGACNIWVNPANRPSPEQWNRYAWGTAVPQAYDLVVFPPTATNAWGHIASVDHAKLDAAGNVIGVYVMDTNWNGDERRAAAPHDTGNYLPYGFYRLRSLERGGGGGGSAPPSSGVAWSCGDSSYGGRQYWTCAADGARYRCSAGAPQREACELGCAGRAAGTDDLCIARAPAWRCASSAYGGAQWWTCAGDGNVYRCQGTAPAMIRCPAGCSVGALGTHDACR